MLPAAGLGGATVGSSHSSGVFGHLHAMACVRLVVLLAIGTHHTARGFGIGCDDEYHAMCSDQPHELRRMVQCLSMQPQNKLGRWCKEWMHVMARCIDDVTGNGTCGDAVELRDKYVCISMWRNASDLTTNYCKKAQAGAMKGAKKVKGVPGGSIAGGGGTHARKQREKEEKAEAEAAAEKTEKKANARKKRNREIRARNKARRRKKAARKKKRAKKEKEGHGDL